MASVVVATVAVGAGPIGVTGADAVEGPLAPAEFVATTLKV